MKRILSACLFLATGAAWGAQPGLVVLTGTGEQHEGLPKLTRHAEETVIQEALSSGFPRRVLRLYGWVQNFRSARDGVPAEPAYLYLSENQGGFPRYGFFLDGVEKPDTAYVDLHKSSPITGRYGAVDQIFPHEMGHIFIRQLIGELGDGGANQIHATGLRTDRIVAFNEGFGEHFQIMTLEDPEAPPETSRLGRDGTAKSEVEKNLRRYRRSLEAVWSPGAPARMRFLFWFSKTESLLRHHWVKDNAFARSPSVDARLLTRGRIYEAYLLENVLPGEPDAPAKPASILVSTEGVVSAIFFRWMTDRKIQQTRPGPEFYALFGTSSEQVSELENAYLKLFYVFASEKPQDVVETVAAYRRAFPEEAASLDEIVSEALLGQAIPTATPIWLANPDFETGTTLFDQYRGLPRIHTFDLNAASQVDLMGVPGMSLNVAEEIGRRAPFSTLDELRAVEGVYDELFERFRRMAVEMAAIRSSQSEQESDLSLQSILMPFARRALLILGICGPSAAFLYRAVRKVPWWRAALNGLAASFLLLASAWLVEDWAGWKSILTPLAIFGAPAGAWQFVGERRPGTALRVFVAWLAAVFPAAASIQTWL